MPGTTPPRAGPSRPAQILAAYDAAVADDLRSADDILAAVQAKVGAGVTPEEIVATPQARDGPLISNNSILIVRSKDD